MIERLRDYSLHIGIALLVVAITVAVVFATRSAVKEEAARPTPDPKNLAGLMTGTTPWTSNTDQLSDRLAALNLPRLSAEGNAMHIHQHLEIYVDGQFVPVPQNIGIPSSGTYIATIHTHDGTGIVHVESPTVEDFNLGQVFGVWGLKLTQDCIGGYCSNGEKKLEIYVNGTKYEGDPNQLKLDAHQQIMIVYGTADKRPEITSSYTFPEGY